MKKIFLSWGFAILAVGPFRAGASELESLEALLRGSSQAVVVRPEGGVKARVQWYEKQNDIWAQVREEPAVIGRAGFAASGQKREGDRKTPAGVFELGTAFGIDAKIDSKMPYRQTTDEDKFIDDVQSDQYNTWVRGPTAARSFEKMRRSDSLYDHGIVVRYNMDPVVRGRGSAVFLHQWRGPDKGTMGCVAMSRDRLLALLKWLDPARQPRLVLNPESLR